MGSTTYLPVWATMCSGEIASFSPIYLEKSSPEALDLPYEMPQTSAEIGLVLAAMKRTVVAGVDVMGTGFRSILIDRNWVYVRTTKCTFEEI